MNGSSRILRAIAEVDRLKESTSSSDWDSYGAGAIALSERERAKECLRVVGSLLGDAFTEPVVSPISDPGVALAWKKRGKGEVDALFTSRGATYIVIGQDQKHVTKGPISDFESFARDVLTRYLA